MNSILSKLSVVSVLALSAVSVQAADRVASIEYGPRQERRIVYRAVAEERPYALTGESAVPMKLVKERNSANGRDRLAHHRWE